MKVPPLFRNFAPSFTHVSLQTIREAGKEQQISTIHTINNNG